MFDISVVAPIFNEENNVTEFIRRVENSLKKLNINFQTILVDDGSEDNSWEVIKKEIKRNTNIKAIKLSRNFGHHYAITAGLHKSDSKWTVVMDSDLQDRPEVIEDLYLKAIQGFDVVFVSRTKRPESFLYLILQKLFYILLNLFSGLNFDSSHANFSIINQKVVEAFKLFPENSRFYASTIKWLGFNSAEIKARHGTRFSGRPSYTFKKRLKLALDVILSFSDRPLKFAIFIGTLMSIFAMIMTIWIIWGAVSENFWVVGWPSIMASIFLVGGTILTVLGIMGTYLGRVFAEVKKRPLYIISEEI